MSSIRTRGTTREEFQTFVKVLPIPLGKPVAVGHVNQALVHTGTVKNGPSSTYRFYLGSLNDEKYGFGGKGVATFCSEGLKLAHSVYWSSACKIRNPYFCIDFSPTAAVAWKEKDNCCVQSCGHQSGASKPWAWAGSVLCWLWWTHNMWYKYSNKVFKRRKKHNSLLPQDNQCPNISNGAEVPTKIELLLLEEIQYTHPPYVAATTPNLKRILNFYQL